MNFYHKFQSLRRDKGDSSSVNTTPSDGGYRSFNPSGGIKAIQANKSPGCAE